MDLNEAEIQVLASLQEADSHNQPTDRATLEKRAERYWIFLEDWSGHSCPQIEQGGGTFVNISSMNTVEPRAPYPMSMLRAALHSFAKLYGDRYAKHNISMNNLMPGFCANMSLSEFALDSIPARRLSTFEEIGQACVFLASGAARYINGQSILSDGGMNRGVH